MKRKEKSRDIEAVGTRTPMHMHIHYIRKSLTLAPHLLSPSNHSNLNSTPGTMTSFSLRLSSKPLPRFAQSHSLPLLSCPECHPIWSEIDPTGSDQIIAMFSHLLTTAPSPYPRSRSLLWGRGRVHPADQARQLQSKARRAGRRW